MSYYTQICDYTRGIYSIASLSYYIYKYNLVFYLIYLLLIKRSYVEAFIIIYNVFR